MMWRILRGERQASIRTLARIALALGADVTVRLTPGAGVAIHDRTQVRMVEAFIAALHPRWTALPEVFVRTPARGAIDLVIVGRVEDALVAAEIQSQLRRVEQTIRWSNEKAAALTHTDVYRMAAAASAGVADGPPAISRLLVLRSTPATRAVVKDLPALFSTAYPVPSAAAVDALRRGTAWPGDAIVWMCVRGRDARLMDGLPRELRRASDRW